DPHTRRPPGPVLDPYLISGSGIGPPLPGAQFLPGVEAACLDSAVRPPRPLRCDNRARMRRLDRYVISETLGPLALGFTVYTFILLVRFLFQSADMIIRRGLS